MSKVYWLINDKTNVIRGDGELVKLEVFPDELLRDTAYSEYMVLKSPSCVTVPDAPTGVVAMFISDIGVSVSWKPPANDGGMPITNYQIERKTFGDEVGSWSYFTDVTPIVPQWVDITAAEGVKYFYRVRAINSIGNGIVSSEVMSS